MMVGLRIIESETERTTAATDLLLALAALGGLLLIRGTETNEVWKRDLWLAVLTFLVLSAVLGTIVHGLHMGESTRGWLWRPLYLSLGLMVALFVVAAIGDLWGRTWGQRWLWPVLGVAVLFFGVTLIRPGSFRVFFIYEAAALIFAIAAYGWLALSGSGRSAPFMVVGILVTMIAAVIQAVGRARLYLIWAFDHNGIFHLIQLVGLVFLTIGIRLALASH